MPGIWLGWRSESPSWERLNRVRIPQHPIGDVTFGRIGRHRGRTKGHRRPALPNPDSGVHISWERVGLRLFLKLEMLQRTGSFKPRGVLNKLHHPDHREREKGVISLSAGNHAQAVAYGAGLLGIRSTVVMPLTAVRSKVDATRSYGAEIVLTDEDLLKTALSIQQKRDLTMVHPFDDPLIIAGAGTLGAEILEDLPEVEAIVAGVGGGGLISGTSAAAKLRNPRVKIFGVEPAGAPTMTESLKAGGPVHLDRMETVADGLAAPFVGENNLTHAQKYVDEIVLVKEEEIIDAVRLIVEKAKVVAEPAAAAAYAALLCDRVGVPRGSTVVCILSGGNVDMTTLREIL